MTIERILKNTKLLSFFGIMIMIVGGIIPFTSIYGQNNMTSIVNNNNTEQIAEDFKDCFGSVESI
jgi:hypothetical protein